ncbi:MAG TPA: ROK family protein [Candidatus Hydrogenedentes bacterium]|nr:ROK family protein [Candidatus Hydrogenedentota bacterium]
MLGNGTGRCVALEEARRLRMDIRKLLKPGEFVLGLDIGGTKMLAAVFDHEFRVVAQAKKKSKTGGESDVNASAEQRVIGVITEAIQAAGAPPVRGIGVGSPGPLDPATGIIIDTPNLGWKNFPLAERLREKFGVPVLVDNDVNVGTYGEWRFGKVSDCRHVVGIFPGTGIGGGIIVDGKMLHGFSGAAGEVGHMTVEPGGPFCGCGKRGCLEAVASRIAIAKEVAALAAREDAPYIKQKCGTDLSAIRSGVIAKAIQNGEKMVESVVRKAAYYIGIAAGNLINILSPEAVVIGGGLVEAMPDLYLEEVKRGIADHAMPFLRKGVRVQVAALGDLAVAMGGACMIAERIAEMRKD